MDWVALLEANNVEYVSRGPNTKRGEISIRCPFCGEDDPSTHMGINLTTGAWGCLRNARHRGKSTGWLIQNLLGCSNHQAKLILQQFDAADPDTGLPDPATMFEPISEPENGPEGHASGPLTMPGDFRRIGPHGLTARYWSYLIGRGFTKPDQLIRHYRLRCALVGRWKGRVLIPIFKKDELIGWTGRAITKVVTAPRYLSSGEAVKTTVLNYDRLYKKGGRLLTVVEGPIDALKLDYFGEPFDARATCVFGTSITPGQINDLNILCSRFDHVAVLMDPDAVEAQFDLREWLIKPNVSMEYLADGIEDPGAMTEAQVHSYVRNMLTLYGRRHQQNS